jgi:pyruvate-formate lyase-activating enzyme
VGWKKGNFYVSAYRVDLARRQNPSHYTEIKLLKKNTAHILKEFPKNRLFKHLSFCALTYNCRNAQNLFLGRWEAPLPVSPHCNASCLGCLSRQETDCALASHERISFVPTPHEVAEVAVLHLKNAAKPIVSFGQGCEGEPLLQFSVLREAIEIIRMRTQRGTIHLNTNGSHPEHIRALARAGLNSVRISVNSFKEEYYRAYFRPRGYSLPDVLRAAVIAKKSGLFVSLNLLTFPGLTDRRDEVMRLVGFLRKGCVDFLQMRNLCIDQDLLLSAMPVSTHEPLGILEMIKLVKKECPNVRLGYFNRSKEAFYKKA